MLRYQAISALLLLTSIASVLVSASSSSDVEYGCGIFISDIGRRPSSSSTLAENRTFYNNFCSNWQCSRAIPVSFSDQKQQEVQYVCVRGAEVGDECLVDSDCYAFNEDVSCDNVSIGVNVDTNQTLYDFRCTKHKQSASASVAGFIAVLLASIFWGSNFIPARQAKAGNGILFQFFMCSGIVTVGFWCK